MAGARVDLHSNAANCRSAIHAYAASLINHVARATKGEAIDAAPEDTGNLKSKIEVTEEATPDKPEARLESGAEYSEAVNFGHHTPSGSFVAADPFFTRAVERAPEKAKDFIEGLR